MSNADIGRWIDCRDDGVDREFCAKYCGVTVDVKLLKDKQCVYRIFQKSSGKSYVGSTADLKRRWKEHLCDLRYNHHPNKYLQNTFNKYGEDDFEFQYIADSNNSLLELEQCWMDKLQSYNKLFGFNLSNTAVLSPLGIKRTEATKLKMSLYGNRKLDEDKVIEARYRASMGENIITLSAFFNVSKSVIHNAIVGKSWKHVPNPVVNYKMCVTGNKGSKHGKAILDEKLVIEARKRANSGERIIEIAQEMGVSKYTINCAVRGKSWQHVKGNELEIQKDRIKLDLDKVHQIKELLKTPSKIKDVAKKYDVSYHTIWKIKEGKTWKE